MPYYYDYEGEGRKWVPDQFDTEGEGRPTEADAQAYEEALKVGAPSPHWQTPEGGLGMNLNDYLGFDPASVQRWEELDDGGDGGSRGAGLMSEDDKLTKISAEYGLQRMKGAMERGSGIDYFNQTYGTNFQNNLDYQNWVYSVWIHTLLIVNHK